MHTPQPHDLLKLRRSPLAPDAPQWAHDAMRAAPVVVVRRAPAAAGRVAVGLRGTTRGERFAATADMADVAAIVSPDALLDVHSTAGRASLGPFVLLRRLRDACLFGTLRWGPTGSTGFELATGLPTISPSSDLDLLVQAPKPICRDEAARLQDALLAQALAVDVRVDVQIATPAGGIALAEWAARKPRTLVRTAEGPHLIADPWQDASRC